MLTEEQAKGKWCPFTKTPNYIGTALGSTNRNIHGEMLNSARCIASQCMAWREAGPIRDEDGDEQRGYCGLAGRLP